MKSAYSFFYTVVSRAVLILAASLCLTVCKSTPKNESSDTKDSKQLAGQWQENEMSDTVQTGYFYTGDELKGFSSVEVEFKKESGYAKSAFGLVFAYTTDEKGKLSSYVRFEITVDGECALYTVDGSSYTDLIEKNTKNTAYLYETESIKKGYANTNTLTVSFDEDGTYSCYINGKKTAEQVAAVKDGVNSLMPFFSVGKDSQEELPDKPVRVSYRIVSAQ